MKLRIEWARPIRLRDARKDRDRNMVYAVDLNRVSEAAGVYIFGRIFGAQFEALYIGKANTLRGRIHSQLNNLKLIQHLLHAKKGKRVVLPGRLVTGRGARLGKSLVLAEKALIRHYLSEAHDLVNVSGNRIRYHELASSGNYPKRFIPSVLHLERAKGE